jgi:tRNA (cmo5U34)-methyltransferase
MTAAKIEFDRDRASEYDLDIRKAIPGYEALHGMAHSLLQTNLSESARLLVVGSGTGMELINYCQQNPTWSLTGVDPSAEMMAIALEQLVSLGYRERVQLHTGYISSLPETEPMDAATLMLVMHFLPDDGSKLQLLKDIARHLKPGAELILADLYGDRSLPYFDKLRKAWQALYFSQLDDAECVTRQAPPLQGGEPRDESRVKAEANFQTSIDNSIYFITEARIIELLQAAGFSNITKFYNAFLFGGWIAQYTGS